MELGVGSIAFIYDSINNGSFNNSIDLLLNSIEKTFTFAENNDLKICELIIDPPEILIGKNAQELIDLCSSYPLIEKQLHAPYADLSLCTHNPWILNASIECYAHIAKICKEINSKVYTVHPGDAKFLHHSYNGVKNRLINSVNRLLDEIRSDNLISCLENMPKMAGFFLDYYEIAKFFSEVKRNDIYLTWDTGHSASCNDNIEKLWENIHTKVKNIHLVDDSGNLSDNHPTLGEGNVDFKKVFDLIDIYNYNGALIMELHKVESLPNSIEYIRKYL